MTVERPSPVPDLDWSPERSRAFGDQALDLWQELIERLPDLRVSGRWTAKDVHEAVAIDVPDEPMPDDALFAYLHDVVFEWSELSGHPRFMAYVSGAGTVPGAAADLIAAGLNANLGGWQLSPAATEIELHLMRWFAAELFGLSKSETAMLNEVPMRGAGVPMPPTDPLIYRFYELVMVNGPAWKALIEEEFGDGIMSAIDFDMQIERLPNPKGDRVKITMSGKFLPFKYYGNSGNVPEYGFKEE